MKNKFKLFKIINNNFKYKNKKQMMMITEVHHLEIALILKKCMSTFIPKNKLINILSISLTH